MGRGADTRFLRQSVVQGSIPDFGDPSSADKIVISQIMADRLGLKAGDSIDTYFIIEDLLNYIFIIEKKGFVIKDERKNKQILCYSYVFYIFDYLSMFTLDGR